MKLETARLARAAAGIAAAALAGGALTLAGPAPAAEAASNSCNQNGAYSVAAGGKVPVTDSSALYPSGCTRVYNHFYSGGRAYLTLSVRDTAHDGLRAITQARTYVNGWWIQEQVASTIQEADSPQINVALAAWGVTQYRSCRVNAGSVLDCGPWVGTP